MSQNWLPFKENDCKVIKHSASCRHLIQHLLLQMCHHGHLNIHYRSKASFFFFSPPINCELILGPFVPPTVTQVLYNRDSECPWCKCTKNINRWPCCFDEVVPCLAIYVCKDIHIYTAIEFSDRFYSCLNT